MEHAGHAGAALENGRFSTTEWEVITNECLPAILKEDFIGLIRIILLKYKSLCDEKSVSLRQYQVQYSVIYAISATKGF